MKQISKLGLAPGIFNVNEPVIFGFPIVMNPHYGQCHSGSAHSDGVNLHKRLRNNMGNLSSRCIRIMKSKQMKQISKLGLAPGIFNVNEPVIFGFPIVMKMAITMANVIPVPPIPTV
jgi:cellobiose-specific phosphotransferase system component IIC